MTSNIARDALIETYKSLWTSEGDDDQRDFIIESVDRRRGRKNGNVFCSLDSFDYEVGNVQDDDQRRVFVC